MNDAPKDYANPQWHQAGKIHDWKNYISERVRAMWGTFDDRQQAALAEMAHSRASAEEWE